MEKIANYINGKLVNPNSGQYIDNFSPVNGRVYSLTPNSGKRDVVAAFKAAKKAFSLWGQSTKQYRHDWMIKLADAIDDCEKELAKAESFDNGKPLWLAKTVDIPRCSANLRFFATAILHFDSKTHDMDGSALNYTLRPPIGVAGCISPWNLPLYLLTWKIAPAIAAGNTVVAKPSEITPYTAFLFSKICQKINFPKGVINIVHGHGDTAGHEIVKEADVVSFTGGTETGKIIASTVAKSFKKCSLELGGKNPTVVFADCDFDMSVKTAVKASFLNQGQICLCGSRIFVEKSIYKPFVKEFLKKTKKLTVGDPSKKNTDLGAVVSKQHLQQILSKIKDAKDNGGKIIIGGKALSLGGRISSGYYMAPTIIENTQYTDPINQEEVFGPVVTIMPFNSELEVVKMCNHTNYGLAASIFTNNLSRAHRVAAKIHFGLVWINTWLLRDLRIPFGGMRQSGLGREGGYHSLNFFTETKNVCLKIENNNNI
ncbi:MAG: 2-hydroxymuconic semialdehyde dehydrogenase [Flavobacteriales bacterium]|nr:2-hydroxymuconic semialdehyde dehydrogenase [Flavobacteriales bacterium]